MYLFSGLGFVASAGFRLHRTRSGHFASCWAVSIEQCFILRFQPLFYFLVEFWAEFCVLVFSLVLFGVSGIKFLMNHSYYYYHSGFVVLCLLPPLCLTVMCTTCTSPAFPAADCGGSALLHTAHHTIIITDHGCRHPNLLTDIHRVLHYAGELWVGRV